MQKIITKDNSCTFLNEELGEHYHSISGAAEEAIEKFARPSGVIEKARDENEIVILDVCFGLGYNTAAILDLIRKNNTDCKVIIYAFENDRNILDKIYNLDTPFSSYEAIRKVANKMSVEENGICIKIFIGDAREKIQIIPDSVAHVVLFDPFSPQKVPYMWTEKFFRNIFIKMKPFGRLVTYSCAGMVRRNMKKAGFIVMDGPRIRRWSPSTIAIRTV